MLKHCFKKIKILPFGLFFLLAGLWLACSSKHILNTPAYHSYINYKVKISIKSSTKDLNFKGYVYFVPDTHLCFRFWGLLGYEIGKGLITEHNFSFYNEIQKELVPDLKEILQHTSGCAINLAVLQHLLLGQTNDFVASISLLNQGLLDIVVQHKPNHSNLELKHKVNSYHTFIDYNYSHGILKSIKFKIIQGNQSIVVFIDIRDITYDRKLCTFVL
jgi:hypothetical protein